MALNIGDNFSYLGAKPLDNREVFLTKADLTAVSLSTVYEGMVAYVKSEDKYYRLKGTTWVEFSSGSGISKWAASTVYAVDDLVINGNSMYICTTAHTSGSTFDATEKANWQEIGGSGGTSIDNWASSKSYSVGDIIIYANSLYRCSTAHTSSTFSADAGNWTLVYSDIKLWSSSVYYTVGTSVIESNVLYRCKTAHTSGSTFDSTEKANWDVIGSSDSLIKEWKASTTYSVNDVVIYNGDFYKCITAHTSGSSFNSTEEQNWANVGRPVIEDWVTSFSYQVDDMVIYANSLYRCVTAHTSDSTNFSTDVSNWELVCTDIKSWVSGDYYTIGTCVIDSDRLLWRCTTAHTAGLAFDPTEKANWEMVGGDPDSLTSAQVAALIANFNPAGDGLMQLDNWEPNHGYTVKQVVLYNNKMYRCKTAHTSGTLFDATEKANWDEIVGGGGTSIDAWVTGTNYVVGDFVIYHNKIYQCLTANADASFTPSKWQEIGGIADYASGISYMVGELVFNGTKLCRCKVAHTSTSTFDDSKWDIIAGERTNIEDWATSTKYKVGEVVVRENNIYKCKTAHTSSSAFNTDIANWDKLDNIQDWKASTDYFVDDLVVYDGSLYRCNTSHTSISTFGAGNWDKLGNFVPAKIKLGEVGFVSWQYALLSNHIALDGSTINNFKTNYPELYDFFDTNSILTTVLATYTANKALCYYDSSTDTATMPDFLDKTVWGGSTIEEKSAGLPNIKGTFSVNPRINGNSNSLAVNNRNISGAFYNTNDSSTYQSVSTVAGNAGSGVLNLDASRSSSIYGNSTTVQPPAIQLIPQIRYKKEELESSLETYGNSPIGTIISYMGLTPPEEYLSCDGTAYNIADYWELAEFIKAEFGSYNYFGGDGTTTFAVPDLRGEFLRGTGTNSHTNQGSGANVGVHQDGTEHPEVYAWSNNQIGISVRNHTANTTNNGPQKDDSALTQRVGGISSSATPFDAAGKYSFTSRPTNTSVLYCIKYTNSLTMQPANNYSTTEKRIGTWIDGKPLYQKTYSATSPSAVNTSADIVTLDSNMSVKEISGILDSPTVLMLNHYVSSTDFATIWKTSVTGNIRMSVGSTSYTSKPVYVTIKYTKS